MDNLVAGLEKKFADFKLEFQLDPDALRKRATG
jgi:hypothetical protein